MLIISFMPYFPDREIDEHFGPFHIWNWKFREKYIPDVGLREHLDKYFKIYRSYKAARKVGDEKAEETTLALEDRIAVVADEKHGSVPASRGDWEHARQRFAVATMFSHLATYPIDTESSFSACTAENFVLYFQPFAADHAGVTLDFGSYIHNVTHHSHMELARVVTPQDVPNPIFCPMEKRLLRFLATLADTSTPTADRMFRALEWVRVAFSNSNEQRWEARIIAMTTAFEILLDLPQEGKGRHFSEGVNRLVPANKLSLIDRPTRGRKKTRITSDNAVGWWCRDFYDLRSRIVHGNKITSSDYCRDGIEQLIISITVFEECLWGVLVREGLCDETEQEIGFAFRQFVDALRLPAAAFF